MTCGRCGTRVLPGQEERWWWDCAALWGDCWETYGHCGHAEAAALNARIVEGYRRRRADHTAGQAPLPRSTS